VNDPPPTNASHANDRKDDERATRPDDATTPYSKPGNANGTQTVHTDDFLPQKARTFTEKSRMEITKKDQKEFFFVF